MEETARILPTGARRIGLALAVALVATLAPFGASPALAASPTGVTASVTPQSFYRAGPPTTLTFTVTNPTGSADVIRSVKITRPSADWTSIGCPAATGWTVATVVKSGQVIGCGYTNATTPIAKGSSRTFSFPATPGSGSQDAVGDWSVTVDADASGVVGGNSATAGPAAAGALSTTIYVFEVLDAVVATTATSPGAPCPATSKSAPAGSSRVITVCGKNRGSAAATPQASYSSLGGSFIQAPGTFSSGSVPAGSGASVALANYGGTVITSEGTGKTVSAKIGLRPGGPSTAATSPLTTLAGYSATDSTPPAPPTFISTAPVSPSNDNSPRVLGTAEAGSTVELYTNGSCSGGPATTGTAAAFASPGITVSVPSDSTTTFYGVAADAAGNRSSCSAGSISYLEDSAAPAVTLSAPADGSASTDTTPTFSGTAGTAVRDLATITLKVHSGTGMGGPLVQTLTAAAAGGAWSVDASPALADGVYTARAEQSDTAGNVGLSSARTFTVDTTAPVAPAITSQPADPSNDDTPTWTYTGEPGATFECELSRDATPIKPYGACNGGTKTYTLTLEPDSTYTFRVRQTDQVGLVSPTASSSYTLDRVPPTAPTIASKPAAWSNDDTPTWTYTGEPGATFQCQLKRGLTVIDPFGACNSGTKTYDLAAEIDGLYTFTVRGSDAAGNASADTTDSFNLDRTAPSAPVILTGPVDPSDNAAATWTFAGEVGATFQCSLRRGATTVRSIALCPGGTKTYDLTAEPDGTYTFNVRQTDLAGNVSPVAASTFTLVRPVEAPTITTAPAANSSNSQPTWAYSGVAGATFDCQLDLGESAVSPLSPCNSGTWSYDLSLDPDGTYTFRVRQTDQWGKVSGAATSSSTLDRVAPAEPTITARPAEATNDPAPTWTFAGEADAALECQLSQGGAVIEAFGPCDPAGKRYDLSGQADGAYTFSVRQTDLAGNVSAAATDSFELDRAAPLAPVITARPATPTRLTNLAWSFTGETGTSLECRMTRSGTAVWGWTSCASPTAYDLSGQPDGTYTFEVRQQDAAGNVSPVATAAFRLDRTAPSMTTPKAKPNPFNLQTATRCAISSVIGEAGDVAVKIMKGTSLIRQLTTKHFGAGTAKRYWDGRNKNKQLVKSGKYKAVVSVTDAAGNTTTKSVTITVQR